MHKNAIPLTPFPNPTCTGQRTPLPTFLEAEVNHPSLLQLPFLTDHFKHYEGLLFRYLHLSECLFFPHDISKTNIATIIKHEREMFHDESWKPIYFESKDQRSRSRFTKTETRSCSSCGKLWHTSRHQPIAVIGGRCRSSADNLTIMVVRVWGNEAHTHN